MNVWFPHMPKQVCPNRVLTKNLWACRFFAVAITFRDWDVPGLQQHLDGWYIKLNIVTKSDPYELHCKKIISVTHFTFIVF